MIRAMRLLIASPLCSMIAVHSMFFPPHRVSRRRDFSAGPEIRALLRFVARHGLPQRTPDASILQRRRRFRSADRVWSRRAIEPEMAVIR